MGSCVSTACASRVFGLRGVIFGVPPWLRLPTFLIDSSKLEMKSETLLSKAKLLRDLGVPSAPDLVAEIRGVERLVVLLKFYSFLSCSRVRASHWSVQSSVTVKRESTSTCDDRAHAHERTTRSNR